MRDKLSIMLSDEGGLALVMVLILSVILLAVMSALIYMIVSGTQMSGGLKRYNTALEAGFGGIEITSQVISHVIDERTDPSISAGGNFGNFLVSSSPCLQAKVLSRTTDWGSCNSSVNIVTSDNSTYDVKFDLGNYTVYSKIVDTIPGNSGADIGLVKGGVVSSNSDEYSPATVPYVYSIELDAENSTKPAERAKLSVLYAY